MQQRLSLLFGLTAVSLLLFIGCTQPAAPNTATEPTATAVPPTNTLPPTATHTPAPTATPTPEPTPTLTAAELRNARATAVLLTLPGYDPALHEALLPLARALWGDEYVVDPADVAIVVGETAVHAPAQVALRITADASGAYLPGTLFVWRGEELLLLVPAAPDHAIQPGPITFLNETTQTWVAYDGAGQMVRFLHPNAAQWVTPLNLSETGEFSLFLAQDISPDGQPGAATVWWANGGTAVEITTSPDPDQSLTDYLAASQLQLTQTQGESGRPLVALIDTDTQELRYIMDEGGNWTLVEQAADRYVIPEPIYEPLVFPVSSDANRTPAISRTLPPGVTQYVDRLYTSAEMTEIFRAAGFEPTEGLACSRIDGYRYSVAGVIIGFEDNVTMRIGNEDVVAQTLYWQTCVRDDQGNYGSAVMQNRYHRSPSQEGGLVFQDLNGNPLPINGAFLPETKQRLIGRFIVFTNLGQIAVTNETNMFVYDLVNPFTNGSQALRDGQLPSPETNIDPAGNLYQTSVVVQIDNRR